MALLVILAPTRYYTVRLVQIIGQVRNVLLFPEIERARRGDRVECKQRLGGLLRYYARAS